MIQLQNREGTRLTTAATSRIDASQRNQVANSSISHDASSGWVFFFLARVVDLLWADKNIVCSHKAIGRQPLFSQTVQKKSRHVSMDSQL